MEIVTLGLMYSRDKRQKYFGLRCFNMNSSLFLSVSCECLTFYIFTIKKATIKYLNARLILHKVSRSGGGAVPAPEEIRSPGGYLPLY